MKYCETMPLKYGKKLQNIPKLIIIHSMAEFVEDDNGDIYYAVNWLDKLKLSAHILITPSGVPIKCRNWLQNAYHAKGYNTDSLGIEFLVPGIHNYNSFARTIKKDYLSTKQFWTGTEIVSDWMKTYQIAIDNVVRHIDIDPNRKIDPGSGFPWTEFIESLWVWISMDRIY